MAAEADRLRKALAAAQAADGRAELEERAQSMADQLLEKQATAESLRREVSCGGAIVVFIAFNANSPPCLLATAMPFSRRHLGSGTGLAVGQAAWNWAVRLRIILPAVHHDRYFSELSCLGHRVTS